VDGQANLLDQRSHERQGYIGYIEISLGVTAETQNFQPEAVARGFRISTQITAPLQSAQNVTRGTFGNSEFPAEFRVGESIAALRGGFENIEGALDGRRRIRFGTWHGISRSTKYGLSQV